MIQQDANPFWLKWKLPKEAGLVANGRKLKKKPSRRGKDQDQEGKKVKILGKALS